MRPLPLIPLSLLALLPYSLATPHTELAFYSPQDTFSTTLVDKLSEDPDYTTLLRLLQRARLIPTLNRLNGSTLFAPTNDAIQRYLSLSRLSSLTGDNVNEQLRQELFYHLLNYTVVLPKEKDVLVTKTLHFPHDSPEPPSRDPPPSPPWLPVPGGSLGGEPQRLRVATRKGRIHVGVDTFGEGGAKVVKDPVDAGNGLLVGIDGILPLPPSLGAYHSSIPYARVELVFLAGVVSAHLSTSYFRKILTPAVINRLNETAELTIFVPVDSAWNALHPIEKLYLESGFAADDLIRIFEMHAVVQQGVKWSESFSPAINC
jgi:solute carrier family 25 carnitine/acylcarnitine transporter 20/29